MVERPEYDGPLRPREDTAGQVTALRNIVKAKEAWEYEDARGIADPDIMRMYEKDAARFRAQLPLDLQARAGPDATVDEVRSLIAELEGGEYDAMEEYDLGFREEREKAAEALRGWVPDAGPVIVGVIGALILVVLIK